MLALNAAKRLQLSSVARCILTQTRAEHSAAPIGNGASATSPARPLDRIYLQGMQFFGHHGVLPEVSLRPWDVQEAQMIRSCRCAELVGVHPETRHSLHFAGDARRARLLRGRNPPAGPAPGRQE